MSTQWLAIAYSASNRVVFLSRVVFPSKVAGTRQPELFNSIILFGHTRLLRKSDDPLKNSVGVTCAGRRHLVGLPS
jgi:hypothetical protein